VHSPHYTDHGETHCKTVEKNLDELIPDDIKSELNEYEIFLLLSSVYLHDVGIMCATTSVEENEEIRRNHHKRSEQFIIDNMKDLLNGPERDAVGKISLAHRDEVSLDDIMMERTIRHSLLGNKKVRVRFLAALLRLADSCDLCHTRTTEDIVSLGKLSKEASFHHALHERVSGISFDTEEKTIFVDLSIASDGEKAICQKYLINKLQESLNSVKDHLVKNGIVYVEVVPRFTKTATLSTKLSVPKKMEEAIGSIVTAKIPISKAYKMFNKADALYNKKEYERSLKYIEKALKIAPSDPFAWLRKGRSQAELGKLKEASRSYDNAARFGSEDLFFNLNAGHFFGEIMLDYEKSLSFFKKAYEQDPRNQSAALDYAEALITVDKAQEAYNLATRVWNTTTNIVTRFYSWTIRVISLFFLGEQKALTELEGFFYYYKSTSLLREKNEWVYNKIRKYINQSSLDNNVKGLLNAVLDLIEGKIPTSEFEQRLNAFPKK
jgi:tetratricopeptide (TPR) repeat protein